MCSPAGRGKDEIAGQLADYAGILQVDGYVAYKSLAKDVREAGAIRLAFCLAHARRKFVKVYKTTKSPFAQDAARIAAVYAIEERIRGTSAEIRLAARKNETGPLMAELRMRLTEVLKDISSKSPLAEAINYMLGHWDGLNMFLTDGRVEDSTQQNSTGSIRRLISATCSSVSCQAAPRTINSTNCWPGTGKQPARRLTEPLHECAPSPLRAPADDGGGHAARQA